MFLNFIICQVYQILPNVSFNVVVRINKEDIQLKREITRSDCFNTVADTVSYFSSVQNCKDDFQFEKRSNLMVYALCPPCCH